jgi:hypothetical protein
MAADLLAANCNAGDVDGNGRITGNDSLQAQRLSIGDTAAINRFGNRAYFADVNNDGKIDKADIEAILQATVGVPAALQVLGCAKRF